jgi:hypothetical protein
MEERAWNLNRSSGTTVWLRIWVDGRLLCTEEVACW